MPNSKIVSFEYENEILAIMARFMLLSTNSVLWYLTDNSFELYASSKSRTIVSSRWKKSNIRHASFYWATSLFIFVTNWTNKLRNTLCRRFHLLDQSVERQNCIFCVCWRCFFHIQQRNAWNCTIHEKILTIWILIVDLTPFICNKIMRVCLNLLFLNFSAICHLIPIWLVGNGFDICNQFDNRIETWINALYDFILTFGHMNTSLNDTLLSDDIN